MDGIREIGITELHEGVLARHSHADAVLPHLQHDAIAQMTPHGVTAAA